MPSPVSTRTTMPPGIVVLLLTLLLGIQPITTDLYLPALPSLTRDLDTHVAAVQLTLSGLIIAFGLAQLVVGPLADRFGRRPVLLIGLSVYAVATVLGALAPSVEWLVAWRVLQGTAMAAAVTCGRSIVRDLFEPHEGARVLARALTGLGAIAMLSPVLGGLLAQWIHWRATLVAVAVFGAGTLAMVAWRFEESVPERNPRATQAGPLLAAWVQILGHPTFRAWALLSMATYGGLFVILAASSFVYIDVLGLSKIGYGLMMAFNSLSYLLGTLLCRRLLASRGLTRTVRVGAGLTLAGGASMLALAWGGLHSVWTIALSQALFAAGHGIHQPCGQAGAIGPFPEKAGTAASLSGFLMMVVAFGVGLWVGQRLDGTVMPLATGVGFFSVVVAMLAWTVVQRHGEAPRPAPVAAA